MIDTVVASSVTQANFIQAALFAQLGNIPEPLRLLTFDWTDRMIKMLAYFDREPTEEQREDVAVILTELVAEFGSVSYCEEEYIVSQAPMHELQRLRLVTFERSE